jgi:hypothetical protein
MPRQPDRGLSAETRSVYQVIHLGISITFPAVAVSVDITSSNFPAAPTTPTTATPFFLTTGS